MKKTMRWIFAATAALVITTGLAAQGPGGHRGPGPGGPGPGMFGGPGGGFFGPMLGRQLDLTDAQREQVKTIFEATHADVQAIHEQLKGLHEQMGSAVETGNTAEIDVLASQQGDLTGKLMAIQAKNMVRVRNEVLTSEQIQKLAEMRQKMQERMEQRQEFRRNRSGAGQ
jgi:periplasmic protein CpxP/Spy